MTESNEDVLAELDEEVRRDPPRLFAIYGVYDERLSEDEYPGYVEWGLEFPDEEWAIACGPGSTHISGSAEQMLKSNTLMGEARLVWFP